MAWYDHRNPRRHESAVPAHFDNVGAKERRVPSWLAKGTAEPTLFQERPPSVRPGKERSASGRPGSRDLSNPTQRTESERAQGGKERPSSLRPSSHRPSRPSASRGSMSPSELEAIISDKAAQRAHAEILEGGRAALAEAIESLEQARRDLLYGAEPRLIELAALIARRVIARELKTQPDLVADLVREGMDALASRDKVRVQLGTGFALMAVMVSEQLATRGVDVELNVNAQLSEYGCVVETDIGRVDESIASRIDAVLEAIDAEEDSTDA